MSEPNVAVDAAKLSKAEAVKGASQYLRQTLADEVGNGLSAFTEDAGLVLKFHGAYQQDDRDLRVKFKREKKEKAFQIMVRVRMVGGRMSADQYLACEDLARNVGNGTLRITTRQEFQFHGILKQDLASTMRRLNESLLCTLAACGDVERNVLSCPAPVTNKKNQQMQDDALLWASHVAPKSSSYWDIWLDGEKIETLPPAEAPFIQQPGDDATEPILGKTYLPRKFKTAFAFPDDNCTDVLANDLGYVAHVVEDEVVGYNVFVGGGLGTTPSAQKTFPALGKALGYIPRADVRAVGEAVVRVFRDFGNRSDRKRARIKYLVHDWGMPAFRAKVEEYLGRSLADPIDLPITEVDDHLGWREQGDGKLYLGLPVENGRIKDEGSLRLFSGLRAFFQKYKTPARLTCQQSILLADLEPAWRGEINAWLEEYGIASVEKVSTVRRWSMACPALPTCGLAVTNAERALPSVIDQLEAELERQGLAEERITVRMTGCPNGCARPYNSDIGLVGRSAKIGPDGLPGPGTYTLFLGGSTLGHRLNEIYKDYVPQDKIVEELAPIFARFKAERRPDESFGDFCDRSAIAQPVEDVVEAAAE